MLTGVLILAAQSAVRSGTTKSFGAMIWLQSLRAKMSYISHHHLGGVMFWELSQDSPDVELLSILSGGSSRLSAPGSNGPER